MPKDFCPQVVAVLRAAGWRLETSAKGSHEKWRHPGTGKTVIVSRAKSRHTASETLKQAGLGKRLLRWARGALPKTAATIA